MSSEPLIELLQSLDDIEARRRKVRALEHVGGGLTQPMIERLNKTFITPIDREDIHELACRLDAILDLVDTAVDRIQIVKIDRRIEEARR
jgi:hypothetical protein